MRRRWAPTQRSRGSRRGRRRRQSSSWAPVLGRLAAAAAAAGSGWPPDPATSAIDVAGLPEQDLNQRPALALWLDPQYCRIGSVPAKVTACSEFI